MTARLLAALILVALTTSCRWPLTGGTVDQVSIVHEVTVPDTVQAGRSFVLRFTSATGDPRWASAGDEIHSTRDGVLVIPRDRYYDSEGAATVVVNVVHVVPLTLRTTGSRKLYIRSRVYVPDGLDSMTTLVFPLTVLP